MDYSSNVGVQDKINSSTIYIHYNCAAPDNTQYVGMLSCGTRRINRRGSSGQKYVKTWSGACLCAWGTSRSSKRTSSVASVAYKDSVQAEMRTGFGGYSGLAVNMRRRGIRGVLEPSSSKSTFPRPADHFSRPTPNERKRDKWKVEIGCLFFKIRGNLAVIAGRTRVKGKLSLI